MKPGKTKIRKLQIANNCHPKMEQNQKEGKMCRGGLRENDLRKNQQIQKSYRGELAWKALPPVEQSR